MANVRQRQQETVALIDTAKALSDKIAPFLGLLEDLSNVTVSVGLNPIKYLLMLLEHLGVTEDEIKDFLAKYIIYAVPALEVAVKAILLTNFKNMIACSADPRIPYKFRKLHKTEAGGGGGSQNEYGIDIPLETIDIFDKLSIDPLSEEGKYEYFGNTTANTVYEFAIADDFDAFLWFVMHKGSMPDSTKLRSTDDFTNETHGYNADNVIPAEATLLSKFHVIFDNDPTPTSSKRSSILPGSTFEMDGSVANAKTVSMCIRAEYDETSNKIISNYIVPVSDDHQSLNWYKSNAAGQVSNIIGKNSYDKQGNKKNQKGKAICNLQYIDKSSDDSELLKGMTNSVFRLAILPKAQVHVPNVLKGEFPWNFKKLTFNEEGWYSSKGDYTANFTVETHYDDKYVKYGTTDSYAEVCFDGHVRQSSTDAEHLLKYLYPCYNGLTVYEFNYDLVMGMRLFDAKVITSNLLKSLSNVFVGFGVSMKRQEAQERVKEIIKNIINTDDSEVEDCYFTFDNSKYDAMLQKAEEKRARAERFGNTTVQGPSFEQVRKILEEYDETAEQQVQVDVIGRAITQASVALAAGVDDKDKETIKFGFVTDLLENLVFALVCALMTPKVILLFEVNKAIMGGYSRSFSFEDLIKMMKPIIVAMVKEIRDMVIAELLKMLMNKLSPFVALMENLIVKEAMDDYMELMRQIIKYCSFSSLFKQKKLGSILDVVDYADIDPRSEQPVTNNC